MFARLQALVMLLLFLAAFSPAAAQTADPTRADVAKALKDWLKLSDSQAAKLKPVVEKYSKSLAAASEKQEGAASPDLRAFLVDAKKARKEFDASLKGILNVDQYKQVQQLRVEVKNAIGHNWANQKVAKMQAPLGLSTDQVTKLTDGLAAPATKILDVALKYGDQDPKSMSAETKTQAANELTGALTEMKGVLIANLTPEQAKTFKDQLAKKLSTATK